MKAFLYAVAACIVISVAAWGILTAFEDIGDRSRATDSVRVN